MTNTRKFPIVSGRIYHIFNKSIAGYHVFNSGPDYEDFLKRLLFYNSTKRNKSFSGFMRDAGNPDSRELIENREDRIVKLVAYCFMPTHFHLILEQEKDNGISELVSNLCDSYTRHFNLNHKRKGPLWQGNFKDVPVKEDRQLLHLTRYLHLNPSTSFLVSKPEDWAHSSYKEYIGAEERKVCDFSGLLEIQADSYREFVEDGIAYQRDLAVIKDLALE